MNLLLGVFIFIFLCSGVPVESSSKCVETANYLRYGIEYEYSFIGDAIASAVGTTDRVAGIKYECKILVKSTESCHFLLKITSCRLFDIPSPGNQKRLYRNHPFSTDFNRLMTEKPLIFQMIDGSIVNIQHLNDERLWILNIKRGIVSSFLVSKSESKHKGEWQLHTDVQGTCPQKLTTDGTDDTKFKTVKDMLYCRLPQRKYYELSPWSLFNNMSFIQNVINSSMSCDYNVNEEGINNMVCNERHAIRLESTHNTTTAVQTNVKKTLTLLKTEKSRNVASSKDMFLVESSIVYDYGEPTTKLPNPTNFRNDAFKMMADLVRTTKEETRLFTITMFTKFMKHIRSSPDLVRLVQDIRACKFMAKCDQYEKERALAFLQDALVQCNTVACAQGFNIILKDVTTLYFNLATWTWSNGHVTDEKFADEVLTMCKSKYSRTCWFSLGTILGKLAARHEKKIYRQFPDSIYNSVKYYVDEIRNDCSPAKSGDKNQLNHILTMLKALINVGPKVFYISPNVASKLVKCMENKNIPADIVVASSQLSGLGPKVAGVISVLWKIVGNEELDVQVRTEAYMAMANNDGSKDTAEKILDLFSTIKSNQVKSFIASHIRKLIRNDIRDSSRLTRFNPVLYEKGPRPVGNKQLSDNLMEVLEKDATQFTNVLEEVKNLHGKYSTIESGSFINFFELDNWSTFRNSFGYMVEDSKIYETISNLPRFLSVNHTAELFNEVINHFEIGASVRDILAPEGKKSEQSNYDYFSQIIKGLLYTKTNIWNSKIFNSKDHSGTSKAILDNIKKLHAKVAKLSKSDPYFMSYLKFVGKYTTMVTLLDIQLLSMEIQKQVGALPAMMQKLSDGMHRDNHRNIKLVEAFHQFPTSVGLPLNWTTDATFSFSMRAGIKVDFPNRKTNIYFKPSGALTFINSMFIVLPSVVDAGIQSNSSAFTSTQWNLAGKMLSPNKISIILSAPNKPQEVLNLFRNNYIYHNKNAELLSDYDVQRVSTSWCQEGTFKKLTGQKACHQKSYANVTDLVKPWFSMAGSAKWRLVFYKADRNLKSYNLTLSKIKGLNKAFTYKVDFQAPGSYRKRTVNSILNVGPQNVDFKVTVSEAPDFFLHLKHKIFDQEYDSAATLTDINGNKYGISYESNLANQRIKGTKSINSSPKNIYEDVVIYDKVLKVTDPENIYSWTYKVQKKKTYGLDANMLFKYEKTKGEKSWLHPILPDIFWEAGKKTSWVLFKANIDSSTKVSIGGQKVNGLFYLNVPKADLEIATDRVNSDLSNSMTIKAKKIEVTSKKLKSFADITFGKEVDVTVQKKPSILVYFNVTVPRHSIAFKSTFNLLGNGNMQTTNVLTFAKMFPKANRDWFHVGWWHIDTHQRFELKSWTTKFEAEAVNLANEWPLISKIDGVTDITSYGGHSFKKGQIDRSYWLESSLTYPHGSKENTITMKGHIITDHKAMKGFSMFRQVQLHSKIHDTTVKWIYYLGKTENDVKLHGKVLHYKHASEPYGKYKISFDHKVNPWNMKLNHFINVKHFQFSSTIVSPEPNPTDLIITIDTSSDIWKTLNFNLYQYFSFGISGWELMNCSDSFGSLKVNANWTDPWYKTYQKTANLDSKTPMIPNMKLEISHKDVHQYEAKIHFTDSGNILKLVRTTPSNMKSTGYYLNYMEDNVDNKMVHMNLRLLDKHIIVGNVSYDKGTVKSFLKRVALRSRLMSEHWNKIKDDPNHGMNRLLAKWVQQKTIVKYLEYRKKQREALVKAVKEYTYSFVKTWDVFYKPSFEIPVNAWKLLKSKAAELDEEFRQKTYSGWAWYYFDVPGKLRSHLVPRNLRRELRTWLFRILAVPKKYGFMFSIIHPFKWLKFNEYPQITPELRDFLRNRKVEISSPKHADYKAAIVYGDGEIYTFDEKTYRFSGYPDEGCAYVLASDFVYGGFSILKSEDSITLVLKNDFYKINNKNQVFVNGETSPANLPLNIVPKGTSINAYISGMENILEINTDIGLYIVCDSKENTCAIKLDKRYRSKTAGLLGDYDGESFNDFKLTRGTVSKDLYSFIASYEMTGKKGCKDKTLMKSKTQKCSARNEKRIDTCNELFDHNSITSENYYCFGKVYAEPFLKACKKRTSCSEFSACEFQSAYRTACYNRGIKLRTCQKCNDGFRMGDLKATDYTRTVQIALIVDQNSNMFSSDSRATGLKSLLEELDSTFEVKKGYSSRSFSLITFGHSKTSPWKTPQIHLASNKVWHSAETLEKKILKKLRFDGNSRTEPIPAIEFALTNLKFDPEASQVFVVVTVDDTLGSRDVRKTLSMLQLAGISLYSVAKFPAVYKGKHIYGVRGDGYVFPHPEKAKKEDREELFVSVPNGPVAKLTSALDGSIFHREFLEENENKAYFEEFAEEVLAKVFKKVKSKSIKKCHCVPDELWGLKTICSS